MPKRNARRSLSSILAEARRRYVPRGWTVVWVDGPWYAPGFGTVVGLTNFDDKVLTCVEPKNDYYLRVFLHECGHIALRHDLLDDDDIAYGEWEAEMFSFVAMASFGRAIPEQSLQDARSHVRVWVEDTDDYNDDEVLQFAYGKAW